MAGSITCAGQTSVKGTEKYLEDNVKGMTNYYIDTDSVSSNSEVHINDEKMTIEHAFNSILGEIVANGEKEYIFPTNDVFTPCIDNECKKVTSKKIRCIYRHKVSKPGFKIISKSENNVHITEDHSLMVLRNGKLCKVKPVDILDDDKIVNLCENCQHEISAIKSIERVDFEDEYVYDIIMEDSNTPYFFADDILVHNSVFLNLQPFVDNRFNKKTHTFIEEHDFCTKMAKCVIQPVINEFYERLTDGLNTVQKTLSMEFEALADTWLIVEKKRYSMRIVNDEGEELFNRENGHLGKWNFDKTKFEDGKVKLKTRGLSLIQSVTPQFAREKLKKSVELIFETKDEKRIKNLFAEWKSEFMNLAFEEIGMPRSVTTFTKYENGASGAQAHIRAALCYNKYIKEQGIDKKYKRIRQGDKIKFVYLKTPNKFGSNVIACLDRFPEEWINEIPIDWDLQWEKCFTSQLKKIFETINWNVSEDSISLEDFFA